MNKRKKYFHELHYKAKLKNTYFYCIIVFLISFTLTGCKVKNKNINLESDNIPTISPTPTILVTQSPDIDVNTELMEEEEIISSIEEVNYSDSFNGIEGCAVFFNSEANVYRMNNKELCEKRSSPCSTFKIITTIMGLEAGILSSIDTSMGYDGTLYSMDTWNKDLSLKNAFNESCIWYFRKVMDQIGKSDVQKYLDELKYGNCDISEWNGSGINPLPEMNGFWLESTLEVSPVEQVNVLAEIFDGRTDFLEENIGILKEVMLVQKSEDVSIYGKTGTGRNPNTGNTDNAWFVGMIEKSDERYYFAVHLMDESQEVSGAKAKEIALDIINQYYSEK